MGDWPYTIEAQAGFKAFFDYWLKGEKNGIMDEPPVRMMVRSGWGGYYWQDEDEWPIARTQYTRYYLDAAPSSWKGDGKRNDFMKLSSQAPSAENKTTYAADPDIGEEKIPPGSHFIIREGGDPGWSHGVSFVTEPLSEDVLLAGYLKLGKV